MRDSSYPQILDCRPNKEEEEEEKKTWIPVKETTSRIQS
jgi:hypothetical protein